jgi:transposase
VQVQFAEKFPETPVPHRDAVRRLIEKFHETGLVSDAKRSGRPSELNDEKLMDISDYAVESIKITAQVGKEEDIRLATAQICRKCL